MNINDFFVGQTGTYKKKIKGDDVYAYAEISGDYNPIHINPEEAANSVFGRQVAHGMLTASYISTVIGTIMPGKGSIYLGQNLKFVKPVFLEDTITATVTVKSINCEKNILELETQEFNQDGTMVVDGTAIVKIN